MLREAMAVAVAYDLPADPGTTRQVLSRSAAVLAEAGLRVPPLADWPAATALLDEFLSESRVIGDSEVSVRIAGAAEALAEEDPVAALLPAAVVVAEWEGGSADWLFSTRRGAANWGWHGLVLPLARIMARIPALWSGRTLVEDATRGMWLVRARDPGDLDWHTTEALAGLRGLRDQLENKYLAARDRLARDVQRASRPAAAPIRGPLAALWWTLGDPWHAHGVAGPGFTPTLNQVRRLADRVLRRASLDPMLAAVGDRLWRGPDLDAAGQQSVRRRMGWYLTLSRPFAQLEALTDTLGVSPSNAYSRSLTSYFSGTSSPAERATIRDLLPHLEQGGGIAAIRFTALHLLLESIDQRSTQPRWQELAQRAATVAARLNYGAPYSYDRSLDLPLYYLDGDPDGVYRAVEQHRAASMELVLRNLRPLLDAAPAPAAAALLADEKEVLAEIRWFRHGSRLPRLAGRGGEGSESVRSLEIDAADRDAEHDPRLALADRLRRLDAIRGELAPFAPGYVAAGDFRAGHAADLARAFGTGPPGLPAMPAGQPEAGQPQAGQAQVDQARDPDRAQRLAQAEALMAEGLRQERAHEYQVAVAAYETVLECFGADPDPALRAVAAEALMGKGLAFGELGQPAAEMQAYDEAAERYGGDLDPAVRVWVGRGLFNKSVVLRQLGRPEAALAVYHDLVSRFGQDPAAELRQVAAKALVRHGDVLRELGRTAAAIAAYDEVAARFADSDEPDIRTLVRTARDRRNQAQAAE
jgi:tetratricopeptide (TPR) repeat protein